MIRAMCPQSKSVVPFRVEALTRLLGFESNSACLLYCRLHGLEIDEEEEFVQFSRLRYDDPEELPEKTRARRLVESKRIRPWSIVVNGESLPPPEDPSLTYEPHDSFDADGFLKAEAYDAGDQQKRVLRPVMPLTPEDKAKRVAQLARQKSFNASSVEVLNDLLMEEVSDSVRDAFRDEIIERDIIKADLVQSIIAEAAQEALKEAKNKELKRLLALEAKLAAFDDVAEELFTDLVDEMAFNVAKEVQANEMRLEQKRKRLENLYEAGTRIAQDLISNVVDEEVAKVASIAMDDAVEEKRRLLEALMQKRRLRLLKASFGRWRNRVEKRKRFLAVLENFPPEPNTSGDVKLEGASGQSLSKIMTTQNAIERLFEAREVKGKLAEALLRQRLDVQGLLRTHNTSLKTWKCLIYAPNINDVNAEMTAQLIKRKFANRCDDDNPDLIHLALYEDDVRVVVRVINDDDVLKKKRLLLGSSSLLYLHHQGGDFSALMRLLDSMPEKASLAVTVLTYEVNENALAHPRMSSVTFEVIPLSPLEDAASSCLAIHEAASSMIRRSKEPKPEKVAFETLREFAERLIRPKVLVDFFRYGNDFEEPFELIRLHNAAVERLRMAARNADLPQISWPVVELDDEIPNNWNDSDYLKSVDDALRRIVLPNLNACAPVEYLKEVIEKSSFREASAEAASKLDKVLKRRRRRRNPPWGDILAVCVDFKLMSMPQLTVGYFMKDIEDFGSALPPVKRDIDDEESASVIESRREVNLLKEIDSELENSFRFEAKLIKAASNESALKTPSEDEEEPRFVSAIAALSPSLARIASPRTSRIKTRPLKRPLVMTPTPEEGRIRRRRKSSPKDKENFYSVEDLKSAIEDDLNASSAFEKRLEEATQ